jgi:putative membrane protein
VVFRTNTAYERFKEGCKNWGRLINTVQKLARHIWVIIQGFDPKKRAEKIEIMRLLVAFIVAAKLYLREEPINSDLARWLPAEDYTELQKVPNPPQQIAFWIEEYLQEEYKRKSLTSYQLSTMHKLLDKLVDSLGSCDRIIKTPIPLIYGIRLKQLLLLYCVSLPFQVVEYFRWYTWLVVAFITFVLLGIEEINSQIENPFDDDDNDLDLDLDASCETVIQNIESLISHEASTTNWQLTAVNGIQDPQF